MGKSASSSAMLKGACDHIIVGFSRKGTFECDLSLERYTNDQMKVVRVTRYVVPMKAKGYGLGHEFLVVDLRTPEDCQLLIRAEKEFIGRNHEEYRPGGLTIVTRIVDPLEFTREHKDRAKYAVVLQGNGKILMKDLIAVLGACNGRYSLWRHNCWKYADNTLRNLLEKFVGLPDTSDDCKNMIHDKLTTMPHPSLPAEILQEAVCILSLKMAPFPLTVKGVKGLAGSSLFKSSVKGPAGSSLFKSSVKGPAGSSLFKSSVKGPAGSSLFKSSVKGPAGSSLFKSSVGSPTGSLAERSWNEAFSRSTVNFLVMEFASMWEKHSIPANEKS